MVKDTRTGREAASEGLSELATPFVAQAQTVVASMTRMQSHMVKAWMRYNIEALGFMKHRFEQEARLVDELSRNNDPQNIFSIYSDFYQEAVSEYSAEAGKLADMGTRTAGDTARQLRREAVGAGETGSTRQVA